MLKSFRYLLFPFAFVYWLVILLRNFLFDKKIIKSASFNFPLICIGNLAVGGTGKTPMTEYLIELLQSRFHVATLSRGYKRRTKGFAIANASTTAIEIGDEPMQFHQKFPETTVAVGEERLVAIPQILYQRPDTDVIILDDAFQHRAVTAGLNILLTDCSNLYTRDLMFPVGDLRDVRRSMKRSDIIVVTKCRPDLTESEKQKISKEINPNSHQQIYFTSIKYDQPYHLFNHKKMELDAGLNVLLLCGIANPEPLKLFLNQQVSTFEMMKFKDHYIFSSTDLVEIKNQFQKINAHDKIIITTEKDAVRLHKFKSELQDWSVYVLPVRHFFLFGEGYSFNDKINSYIESFKKN